MGFFKFLRYVYLTLVNEPEYDFEIREIRGHGYIIQINAGYRKYYIGRDGDIIYSAKSAFKDGLFKTRNEVTSMHIKQASLHVKRLYKKDQRDATYKDFKDKL